MGAFSAQSEILTRFNAERADSFPAALPNKKFTPPASGVWSRITIRAGNTYQMDIGTNPKTYRTPGTIYIQLFDDLDKGNGNLLELADSVKLYFNSWCGATVKCRASSIIEIGNDGKGKYQINVVTPFTRDELI